jgi:hypothetical protein
VVAAAGCVPDRRATPGRLQRAVVLQHPRRCGGPPLGERGAVAGGRRRAPRRGSGRRGACPSRSTAILSLQKRKCSHFGVQPVVQPLINGSKQPPKWPPGTLFAMQGLQQGRPTLLQYKRRVSSTICAKNQALNENLDNVMSILRNKFLSAKKKTRFGGFRSSLLEVL